jgi:hypothetical protein
MGLGCYVVLISPKKYPNLEMLVDVARAIHVALLPLGLLKPKL